MAAIISLLSNSSSNDRLEFKLEYLSIDINVENLGEEACENLNRNEIICNNVYNHMRTVRIKESTLKANNNKIIYLHFIGEQDDFQTIYNVLKEKYNKPCRTKKLKINLQSSEETFTRKKLTWCFKDANIILNERAYLSDQFSFEYKRLK